MESEVPVQKPSSTSGSHKSFHKLKLMFSDKKLESKAIVCIPKLRFPCIICKKNFENWSCVAVHLLWTHYRTPRVYCGYCGFGGKHRSVLNPHHKTVHPHMKKKFINLLHHFKIMWCDQEGKYLLKLVPPQSYRLAVKWVNFYYRLALELTIWVCLVVNITINII